MVTKITRRARRFVVTLAVLACCAGAAVFAQPASCILYGNNWSCIVSGPDGWTLDQGLMAQYGIYAVFYEPSGTLDGTSPLIYVNTNALESATDASCDQFVAEDIASYRRAGYTVRQVALSGVQGKSVTAYSLSKGKTYELCAYTRYKDTCFLVIATANTEKAVTAVQDRLVSVINNMRYMDVVF